MAHEDQSPTEPPLWSIGIAMLIILLAPIILYSFAPAGPIRIGDTVFSDGQQRAHLTKPIASLPPQPDETCLLDPNSPLIVLESSTGDPDGFIKAEVQGSPAPEWPFCPVHAEVRLTLHQVFQKPAVLGTVRDTLLKWFGE
ncbi:conserved hypothetical protein [Candidatus Nitrospira nitrosa]|uniref:Uncharacterized protein n=1 Tax=Candidatus Nitrospira nitrosa TaxID=1742972 RepID=A0A0S4L952_9BACT|nr:hypothetical protein [Candidatus Nitrospira nitrosa]CUS34021.1 conserved hypothetical protein [Candidatus Nitrospira nitrosa]